MKVHLSTIWLTCKKVDVKTVNETVAEVKAQALVDTVRYAITYGT